MLLLILWHNDCREVMNDALRSLQHIPHITIRFPDVGYLDAAKRYLTMRTNLHLKAEGKEK